jgi:uncharacterized protein YoxC
MTEAALIIGLVLLAVLVGSLTPVFYQAVQTLKSIRQFADTTAPRLEQALREVTETTARLNRIGSTVEAEGERLKPLIDSAASLGQTLHGLKRSLQTAGTILTALGPALVAGLGAFVAKRARSSDGGPEEEEDGEAESPAESAPGDADRSFSATPAAEEHHDGH